MMTIRRLGAVVPEIDTLFGAGTLAGLTDGQLLERFETHRDRAGEAAFGVLLARHGPMVLRVCRQSLGNPHDADDAFQAVFLVLARKAGAIRDPDLLANWLYGVALRTASKLKAQRARRKRHEQETAMSSAESAGNSGRHEFDPLRCEQAAALHEEVGRLPAKYRIPIVLCYLKGVSQDETARRLRCPIGTVRSRLARARERLRGRLLRRGIALPSIAIAAALASRDAAASVPRQLAESTIREVSRFVAGQATAGLVSSSAAVALSERVLRTMLFSKLRIAAAVLAAAGTLAWLAVAGTSQSLANADGPPANASKRAAAAPGDGDKPESTVELRGRVLDKASGQPVAGASLALSTDPPASGSAGRAARATTDSQGSFSFRAGASGKPTPFKVIARATGYASDWAAVTPAQPGEITFRLPKDDVPIEGRIVDLEGRPVADVNIQLGPIFKSDDSDLAPYFEKVKKEDLYYGAADFGLLPSASASDLGLLSGQTTDADGRFRMTGIGRDRVVHLIIRGKSIEHDYQRVVTRNDLKDLPKTFHPAQFVHQSAPSKPIVGTVRIKGTGKPAVGVTISMDGHQQAKTDDEGHYRLDGVAKRRQYSLWAQGDSFFTLLKMGIADTPGLEPLTVDLEISRGMPIKGRVLDKDTGRPVKANVEFFPYSHNPHLKDYAPTPGIYQGVKTRDDGTFTVVGIPGPGLLGVRTEGGAYLAADTTLIDRLPKTDYGFPMTAPEANPGDYNAMVPIDEPGEDSPSRIHELRVQAGRSIDVELVDLDGNPVSGAHVAGREPKRQAMGPIPGKDSRKISGSKFTATGLASDHGRYLVIVDPSRKLGKLQAVRAGETSSIKIALEPLGSFKGRIVDPKGQPQAGLEVRAGAPRALTRYWKDDPALPEEVMFGFDQPGALPERFGGEAKTAADGTFVIEGLIPGFPYVIQINQAGQRNAFAEHFSEGVPTKAGATKDLGDLKFGGS